MKGPNCWRLLAKGRARVLAVTVSRKGTRLIAAFRVLVRRPQQAHVADPDSRVGVDVGVRVLATVADSAGRVIERVPNPRPLEAALKELRGLCRERSRRAKGSRRHGETSRRISRLQRRVADIRGCHVHRLTTRPAKTHGEIVVEGLDAAGILRQRGLPGARARRRGLADSALGQTRRQLGYKTAWHGSRLVVAGRFYPSSKTCHACGRVQDIGWAAHWTCAGCGTEHQRDDNAALNLARYEPPLAGDSAVGPVGAAVKRRADPRPGPARQVAMKRGRDAAARFLHNDLDDRPAAVFGATTTLVSSPRHPSHLLLPVIPRAQGGSPSVRRGRYPR
jgi:putative transposase